MNYPTIATGRVKNVDSKQTEYNQNRNKYITCWATAVIVGLAVNNKEKLQNPLINKQVEILEIQPILWVGVIKTRAFND